MKFLIVQVNCNELCYVAVICCLPLHTNYVQQSEGCDDGPPATQQAGQCVFVVDEVSFTVPAFQGLRDFES